MKAKKILALLLAVMMLATVFAGCQTNTGAQSGTSSVADDGSSTSEPKTETEPGPAEEPTSTGDKELVVRISSEPPKLNTLTMTDTISFSMTRHYMENLTMLDENDNVIPGCAESWEISEDLLTYTFKIRDGMKWTNGEPVTAHDFEFAWKKLLDPETAAEYAYFAFVLENGQAYNEGTADADSVGVKAIDDSTLEVKLASPAAYALNMFAFGSLAPINEKFFNEVGLEAYATEAGSTFCTNGAYNLDTWVHDSELTMSKNADYWNASAVEVEKYTFKVIIDASAALNAFEAGEVDMTELTGDQVPIARDAGYEVQNYNDGACFYIQMNTTQAGLNNVKVRTAVANSIDKNAFISAIAKNESSPATGFVPDGVMGLEKDFSQEIVDLNGGETLLSSEVDPNAKALLEEGLAEEGLTMEEFAKNMTMISDDGENAVKIASFVQEQLRVNLGLEIEVESMPFKSRLERSKNMDFSLLFGGWGPDYNDPNSFLDLWLSYGGNNQTGYNSPEYDNLIESAAKEADPAKRMQYFYDAEKLILTDLPIAPVYWRKKDFVCSDKIASGATRTMLQDINLRYVKMA